MGGATLEVRPAAAGDDARDLVLRRATLVCISRFGVAKTTLDDVAREAGLSRATVYRAFPGGKDALLRATARGEIDAFFGVVAEAVAGCADAEELLVAGLGSALRHVSGHDALRAVTALEPELVLPRLAFHRLDPLLARAVAFASPLLVAFAGDPVRAARFAEHLAHVVLSYALDPSPHLDPHDEASLRRFVTTHLLPVLVAPTASPRS